MIILYKNIEYSYLFEKENIHKYRCSLILRDTETDLFLLSSLLKYLIFLTNNNYANNTLSLLKDFILIKLKISRILYTIPLDYKNLSFQNKKLNEIKNINPSIITYLDDNDKDIKYINIFTNGDHYMFIIIEQTIIGCILLT